MKPGDYDIFRVRLSLLCLLWFIIILHDLVAVITRSDWLIEGHSPVMPISAWQKQSKNP